MSNAPFVGPAGAAHRKTEELKRLIPTQYDYTAGTPLGALLLAIGEADHLVGGEGADTAVTTARDSVFLDTATGVDLTIIGRNYGAARPVTVAPDDDATFRKLIPLFAWTPKTTLHLVYLVAEVLLGRREDGARWAVYEVGRNQITLEVDFTQLSSGTADAASASYLHASAAEDGATTYMGDYMVADAAVAGTTVDSNTLIMSGSVAQDLLVDVFTTILAAGVRVVLAPYAS